MSNLNFEEMLNIKIKTTLDNETVSVNNKDYISMDLFINLMRECMMSEVLLGSILHREGPKEITDEEVLMYISERYENTEIKYENEKYFIANVEHCRTV